jgi:hypothetical protein
VNIDREHAERRLASIDVALRAIARRDEVARVVGDAADPAAAR